MEVLEHGRSPITRGKWFTPDDLIRQSVLSQLYCMAEVRPATIGKRFGIDFAAYFSEELAVLRTLEREGLVETNDEGAVCATKPLGRVLIRNIAAVFDAYLDKESYRRGEQSSFSTNA